MKGILYGNFLLNKLWFIGAGAVAAFGTVGCTVLCLLEKNSEYAYLFNQLFLFVQMVVIAVCSEWVGRNLENNIKCRFTDYTLAGGITKNMFVMSELLKNLITMTVGFAACAMMNLAVFAVNGAFGGSVNIPIADNIKLMLWVAFFIGAMVWTTMPLVINLKSSEKAGAVVGLGVGFGIVLPVLLVIKPLESEVKAEIFNKITELINTDWFFFAALGFIAAIYAAFYLIFLLRVKRGDVC